MKANLYLTVWFYWEFSGTQKNHEIIKLLANKRKQLEIDLPFYFYPLNPLFINPLTI